MRNVHDIDDLSARLAAVLDNPAAATELGRRGRQFMLELQSNATFPQGLETALNRAVQAEARPRRERRVDERATFAAAAEMRPDARPPTFTRLAIEALTPEERRSYLVTPPMDVGDATLSRLVDALRLDMLDVEALDGKGPEPTDEPLARMYRLKDARGTPMCDAEIDRLIPVRPPDLQLVEFPFDILAAREDQLAGNYSFDTAACPTVVAIRPGDAGGPRVLDKVTAAVLAVCDGEASIAEIIECLPSADKEDGPPDAIRERIESLFKAGLIDLVRRSGPSESH